MLAPRLYQAIVPFQPCRGGKKRLPVESRRWQLHNESAAPRKRYHYSTLVFRKSKDHCGIHNNTHLVLNISRWNGAKLWRRVRLTPSVRASLFLLQRRANMNLSNRKINPAVTEETPKRNWYNATVDRQTPSYQE